MPFKQSNDCVDKVKHDEDANTIREREISKREKALQAYLEARKLTVDEFYSDPDKSDRLF
jgi:hypothetical protein